MMEQPSPLREPPSKSDTKLVAPPILHHRLCYLEGHSKESITVFFIYIYIYLYTQKRFIQFAGDPVRRCSWMRGEELKGE